MSIVTKTGDRGETSLLGGKRISKHDPRIETMGDLDELSAHLGFVNRPEIIRIQNDLFKLGALLANPAIRGDMGGPLKRIEKELISLEPMLPELRNFILPGGHEEAARLHLARAVCRRSERHMSALCPLPPDALPYLNRLSDYLFLLARKINEENKVEEKIWKS